MSKDQAETLQRIFRDVFDDEALELSSALSRETLEGWDSLAHIRLVSAIEEGMGVTFTLDDIEDMTSVERILAILSAKA